MLKKRGGIWAEKAFRSSLVRRLISVCNRYLLWDDLLPVRTRFCVEKLFLTVCLPAYLGYSIFGLKQRQVVPVNDFFRVLVAEYFFYVRGFFTLDLLDLR